MGKKTFKQYTTIKTGGEISHFFEAKNDSDVVSASKFAKENNLSLFVLGGGSDILVSDEPFNGVVIQYTGSDVKLDGQELTSQAGKLWDDLVEFSVEKDLQGIECLSGIPGTVGAAPIQNIGAYGQELKDTFVSLRAYDTQKEEFVEFSKNDCQFGYRDSVFKNKDHWQKFVIVEVKLKLNKGKKPQVIYDSLKTEIGDKEDIQLKEVRNAVLKIRANRLEDWNTVPNAGSFFKNPIVDLNKKEELSKKHPDLKFYETESGYKVFAANLVEKSGWKGKKLGGAQVSTKHALIITNPEKKATTKEILELAGEIQTDVYEKFGIKLVPEVQYINI